MERKKRTSPVHQRAERPRTVRSKRQALRISPPCNASPREFHCEMRKTYKIHAEVEKILLLNIFNNLISASCSADASASAGVSANILAIIGPPKPKSNGLFRSLSNVVWNARTSIYNDEPIETVRHPHLFQPWTSRKNSQRFWRRRSSWIRSHLDISLNFSEIFVMKMHKDTPHIRWVQAKKMQTAFNFLFNLGTFTNMQRHPFQGRGCPAYHGGKLNQRS